MKSLFLFGAIALSINAFSQNLTVNDLLIVIDYNFDEVDTYLVGK